MTMRGSAIVVLALAVGVALSVLGLQRPGAAQTFTPRDENPQDFPDHPGRDQTFYGCTPCHGFKLVAQQGQSRAQWNDTLDFMTTRHNMPKLEGEARKAVLDYLEAAFPPRTQPRGWQNPFQKK